MYRKRRKERTSKSSYSFSEWVDVAKRARKKGSTFEVREMSAASFLNFKELKSNIVNRKTDSDGGKVQWLNIRWLRFTKKEPYKIMFKYSISDDETFKSVNLKKEEKVDQSSFGLCQYFTQTADQFPRQNILTFSRYGNTFNPCTMGSI